MLSRFRNRRSRKGFTLIELIVVLFILVGLAALIIPTVSGMVGRTTASTSASSIGNVANAIQRYEAQFMQYPDNFDSLKTSLATGTELDTLDAAFVAATEEVTLSLTKRAPLTAAGITSVGIHTTGDGSYALATPTALTNTTVLRGPTTATQVALGLEKTGVAGKYIVLGVGSITDMKGKTMIEPPAAFPSDGSINPVLTYRRFMAIFQINDGTNPLTRAKLVGVLAPDASSVSTELGNYFTLTQPNN
ncbi:MAG: prepilin-type N-terminal cleavage/methylation domain-containing protein [Planctomycetota bacterium]|nr:prepilin-type N-terminal cleavage/methylation domain-containing protein [Planctomycetota bacterium]